MKNNYKTWCEYEDNCNNYDEYVRSHLMLSCIRRIENDYKFSVTYHKHITIEQINHDLFKTAFENLFPNHDKTFQIKGEPDKQYRNDTIEYTILDYLINNREEINLYHYSDYNSVDIMYNLVKIIDKMLYNNELIFDQIVELTDVFSSLNQDILKVV